VKDPFIVDFAQFQYGVNAIDGAVLDKDGF